MSAFNDPSPAISPSISGTLKTISPVDGRVYVERPLETAAGIDRALDSARRAQRAWGSLPLPIRCEILGDAVDAFVAKGTDIAGEITWQIGRPIRHSPGEVRDLEERVRYMLWNAPPALIALHFGDKTASRRHIKRVPLGVVVVVAPAEAPPVKRSPKARMHSDTRRRHPGPWPRCVTAAAGPGSAWRR